LLATALQIALTGRFRHHEPMLGRGDRRGGWWRRGSAAPASLGVLHFRVERERAAIGKLNDTIAQNLRMHIPTSTLRALQVALDELLTNVIMHAEQASGPIEVDIACERKTLATTISYIAEEFDPTQWKPAAANASVATARIGGLGIALVRSLMDEFGYAYEAGRNIVSLRKRC
jgi:anti-sigma regulatory factor (Ser/Thr protein kinase)